MCAFHARRHKTGGNDGGFDQPQVVAGKVVDFGQVADFGHRAQVYAGEAQDGAVDDAEVGFDGRLRSGRVAVLAAHAQVDRDVEHARSFGEVHAQEEDVAPAAVGEIHAHRRRLAQDGEESVVAWLGQFRADT